MAPPVRLAPPTCAVLSVPPWYWSLLDVGHAVEKGAVDMTRMDGYTWDLSVAIAAAHVDARRAAEEAEKRHAAAKRKLFSEVLG